MVLDSLDGTQEAEAYLTYLEDTPFAVEAVKGAVQRGDRLLCAAGSWKAAGCALRKVGARHSGAYQHQGLLDPDLDGLLDEALLGYGRTMVTSGVPARRDGPELPRVQAKPHTSAKEHMVEIVQQHWEDAQKGRVLFCSDADANLTHGIVAAPLARVPKMNPDRTIAPTGRVIWDGRFQNVGCAKEDHPPAYQPRHGTVARMIIFWYLHCPNLPVMLSKKDISEAFRWLWFVMSSIGLFSSDIPGKEFDMLGTIIALYLVMPFGWSGAPGEWMIFAWLLKQYHAAWKPANPNLEGRYGYLSLFLMDDQVLIEALLGSRVWESIRLAEEGARRILGEKAVNRKKDQEEGAPEEKKLIWGFQYDTAKTWGSEAEGKSSPFHRGTIRLPDVKVEKAYWLLNMPIYDRGNTRIKELDLQILGGN